MAKYTLRDGETRRIGSDGILRVEAFEMGTGGASMELAIMGEGVDAVRVHDLSIMVHSLPERATIVVRPKRNGTFGLRSEVRLTVSNAGDSVTFPRVLIDAAEDSAERLAEVTPESGSYLLEAFGTTEGAGITDSAREVRSKMRRAELDVAGLDDVTVVIDGSASMQVNVTPKIIEAAAKYIDALSDAFRHFRATDGQDSIETHKVDELTRFIAGVIDRGARRPAAVALADSHLNVLAGHLRHRFSRGLHAGDPGAHRCAHHQRHRPPGARARAHQRDSGSCGVCGDRRGRRQAARIRRQH